ncbi:thioredoxin, partial [Micrococcus luteus]|nr:thioredoxin [Micrococcus luteus]MBN6802242.1 thioredoxin [Micrococcus luteus]
MTDVTAQPPSDAPSHLRGAVDLSSLGTPASAGRTAPGADAGGGSWVIADADQGLLQQLAQLSAQVPVLLHLHVPGDAASEALYRQFADAVDAQAGRLVLARLDVAKEPAVLQALGLGAGPAVMAVVAGQPVPLVNQEVPEETLRQLMGEILEVARQNGVAGTVPAVAPARQDAGAAAAEAPPVPPLHRA